MATYLWGYTRTKSWGDDPPLVAHLYEPGYVAHTRALCGIPLTNTGFTIPARSAVRCAVCVELHEA